MPKTGLTHGAIMEGSDVQLPIEIQGHLQTTIQTHNAISIGANAYSNGAGTFMDANGYDKIAITVQNDVAKVLNLNVEWSNDGVTYQGLDLVANITSTGSSRGATIVETKARYFRLLLTNVDTVAHTVSAWAYLKA